MPLSEDEERILLEIEENRSRRDFSAEDLERARRLLDRSERVGFLSGLWASIVDFFERIVFFFRRGSSGEEYRPLRFNQEGLN